MFLIVRFRVKMDLDYLLYQYESIWLIGTLPQKWLHIPIYSPSYGKFVGAFYSSETLSRKINHVLLAEAQHQNMQKQSLVLFRFCSYHHLLS